MNPLELLRLDDHVDEPVTLTVNGSVSRLQILERASFVFASIVEAGAAGGTVLVSLDASPNFLAGIVGCWLAGSTPVLLDPLVRKEVWRAVDLTGAKVLLRGPGGSFELVTDGLSVVRVGESTAPYLGNAPSVADDDPLVYLFTSGSTGSPTLVPKNFEQLHVEYRFLRGLFEEPMRVATLVPWCHIFGFIVSFLLPVRAGGVCDLSAGISPKLVLERAGNSMLDLVVAVPAFYRVMVRVLESGDLKFVKGSCRFATSGAAMPPTLRDRFEDLTGCGLTDLYGSTEAGGVAYRHDSGDWIFQPHVKWRLGDDKYLEVSSPSVSTVPRGEFLRMGDLASKTEVGFELLGREDDVVKVGARRISLNEILQVIETSPGVEGAHVAVREVRGEARIVAFVESASDEINPGAVKEHVRGRLADHKVPRVVRVISKLPRTPAGKVDRRALDKIALVMEES